MSDFTPKTRLEKILCGVAATAKTRLEKAVKMALDNAGGRLTVTLTEREDAEDTYEGDATPEEIFAAYNSGKAVTVVLDDVCVRVIMTHESAEGSGYSFVTEPLIFPADGDSFTVMVLTCSTGIWTVATGSIQ